MGSACLCELATFVGLALFVSLTYIRDEFIFSDIHRSMNGVGLVQS